MADLPERKSQKLERSVLQYKEELEKLKEKHQNTAKEILKITDALIHSKDGTNNGLMEPLEDLNYEMCNNILLNLEITLESIGGLEIELLDMDEYIPLVKNEQDLLNDLEMSAKNLLKTISVKTGALSNQERENLEYLYKAYTKTINETQKNLKTIEKELGKFYNKVKKMENL
ncbi:MAG: hypothetical protein ACTSQI_08285 [Candidatus Helarchaeota archaeon]